MKSTPETLDTKPPNGATDGATASAWLSVAAASAALEVSQKTVWRRARSGELTARKVSGARGALVWEICLDASGQTDRPTGQKQAAKQPDKRPNSPDCERESGGQTDRTPNGQAAKATGQTGDDLTAHLIGEVKFLRAALEQRDRDAAELRAALRAALKLTAGTSAPQLTAGDASAPVASDATSATPEPPAKATGAALTYGDIADELERRMRKNP